MEEQKNTNPTKDEKVIEKTAEELKAEAEKVEAEIKELKKEVENKPTENELKDNYQRRLEKALEKRDHLRSEKEKTSFKEELKNDVINITTLDKLGYSEDSEEAQILSKYLAGGLIKNYAEGINHVGVKAEIEAFRAEKNAKAIIDENDSDSVAKTHRSVIENYNATKVVPSDPKDVKAIADHNLKAIGL